MAAYKYIKKRITWDGKRYEVRGKTEAEALEKLAELLDALKDGRPVTSGDTYVNYWFQEWKVPQVRRSGGWQNAPSRCTGYSTAIHYKRAARDVFFSCDETQNGYAGAFSPSLPIQVDSV